MTAPPANATAPAANATSPAANATATVNITQAIADATSDRAIILRLCQLLQTSGRPADAVRVYRVLLTIPTAQQVANSTNGTAAASDETEILEAMAIGLARGGDVNGAACTKLERPTRFWIQVLPK